MNRVSGKTVAVIGAGFGGLALAIRLQSAGVQTVLLEKRERPGGRAYVYEQDGFTFDAGPTVITAPNAIDELFALSGRATEDYVEMLPVDPFYHLVWQDGISLECNDDIDAVTSAIARINPADADGYRKFLKFSEAVFREGYLKLGTVPFQDMWSMLRVVPQLIRLRSHRSVYSVVSGYIKDPHLRQAFSFQSLLIGGNPFQVSSIYALIHALERQWGVRFPRGGTGALVQALVRLFQDLGGEVRLGCPVEALRVRDGRVREVATADGRSVVVDAVASNADVVHTYARLLAGTDCGQAMARCLSRSRFSNSLFVVYFGLKRQYPEIAHHTVLFGPRYRELLSDIFERGVLTDNFSLYLHNPSCTDQSLAPPVPHLGKAPIDWSVMGPQYRDRILDALEKHTLPGLRANLVTSRIFTPAYFSSELNAHLGSAGMDEVVRISRSRIRDGSRSFALASRRAGGGDLWVLPVMTVLATVSLCSPGESARGNPW